MRAAANDRPEIVQLLVNAGASLHGANLVSFASLPLHTFTLICVVRTSVRRNCAAPALQMGLCGGGVNSTQGRPRRQLQRQGASRAFLHYNLSEN